MVEVEHNGKMYDCKVESGDGTALVLKFQDHPGYSETIALVDAPSRIRTKPTAA
jgi:hypothetical protein